MVVQEADGVQLGKLTWIHQNNIPCPTMSCSVIQLRGNIFKVANSWGLAGHQSVDGEQLFLYHLWVVVFFVVVLLFFVADFICWLGGGHLFCGIIFVFSLLLPFWLSTNLFEVEQAYLTVWVKPLISSSHSSWTPCFTEAVHTITMFRVWLSLPCCRQAFHYLGLQRAEERWSMTRKKLLWLFCTAFF